MTMRTCPACNQEVALHQLGGLVLHHQPGGAICPGYVGPVAALKDVAAAVGATAMTTGKPKRGRPQKGRDSLAGSAGQPDSAPDPVIAVGRATAGTSTPEGLDVTIIGKDDPTASPFVARQSKDDGATWTAITLPERKEPMPEAPKKHRRHSAEQYLVLPAVPPALIFADLGAARAEATARAGNEPDNAAYIVYRVRPITRLEKGIQETRIGRVRKAKA